MANSFNGWCDDVNQNDMLIISLYDFLKNNFERIEDLEETKKSYERY